MKRLVVRKLEYIGDKYIFSSPELSDGLVVLEGPNGSGKTTFSDLIYFGLGGDPLEFRVAGKEPHAEVVNDTNNSVKLKVEITGKGYIFTRTFENPDEICVTSVGLDQGDVQVLPVGTANRRAGLTLFSDWMLEQLGIRAITLFSGQHSGKINFTDIARLLYHNQEPDPSRIFKSPDKESFVTDSREFRRAIFEILIGQVSEAYYAALAELKKEELFLSTERARISGLKAAALAVSGLGELVPSVSLREDLRDLGSRLEALGKRQEMLRSDDSSQVVDETTLVGLRERLGEIYLRVSTERGRIREITEEMLRHEELRKYLLDDALRVRKIIHAYDTQALFSPDTCPCCLRSVNRTEGLCICGQSIDEEDYRRVFYDRSEYTKILSSRQQNLRTVTQALKDSESERAKSEGILTQLEAEGRHAAEKLRGLKGQDKARRAYTRELEIVEDEIVEVRVKVDTGERLLGIILDVERGLASLERVSSNVRELRIRVDGLSRKQRAEVDERIREFSNTYQRLLSAADPNVVTVTLDSEYLPVINGGQYRAASARVGRRLMYFATLLDVSLRHPEVDFPRFLLIDTPETAGIDLENLRACLEQVEAVLSGGGGSPQAQVILTLGLNRLSPLSTAQRLSPLSDGERLLKLKAPVHALL